MNIWYVSFFCLLSILSGQAWAGAVITYHGRIVDGNNRPVESSKVTFRIRVMSPNPGKCLLYEETRNINMNDSDGVFVIPIGDGVGTRTLADPGLLMEKIFSNDPNKALLTSDNPKIVCNSAPGYTPQVLDQRQLIVSFDDHSGVGEQILPAMDINFVPLAVSAHDAQNVGGTPAESVLRVNGGNASPLSPTNFSELLSLINGSSNQYEKVGKLNGSSVPALGNGQVLGWNGGWSAITPLTSFTESDPTVKSFAKSNLPVCGANSFLKDDGGGNLICSTVTGLSGGTVTSVTAGTGLKNVTSPGSPITDTGTLAVDIGTNANQIVQLDGSAKLPPLDGSQLMNVVAAGLSGSVNINTSGTITSPQISTRNLYVGNATSNNVTIQAPLSFSDYTWVLPLSQGSSGQVLGMSSTAGQLEWVTPSAGAVTSITAAPPLGVDSSIAATPRVTLPKATAVADGYLDKADWAAFNAKLGSTLAQGNIFVGSGANTATAVTPGGDVSLATDGSFTVTKWRGNPVAAGTIPGTDVGKVYRWSGTQMVASFLNFGDLKTATGASQLTTICAANEKIQWSVVTDAFTCQAIGSLNASAITSGTLSASVLPANTTRWQDGAAGVVYYNGGNVGIGTATPWTKLDVSGSGSPQAASIQAANTSDAPGEKAYIRTYVQGPLSGNPVFRAVVNGVTEWSLGIDNADSDKFKIGKAGDVGIGFDLMTITPTGNVGIGTTDPQYSLDVSGSAQGQQISNTFYGTASSPLFVGRRARGTEAAPTAVIANDTLATFGARAFNGVEFVTGSSKGYVTVDAAENWSTTNNGTNVKIGTTPIGSTVPSIRMTVTSEGKVGIGTIAPVTALDVSGQMTSRPYGTTSGATGQVLLRELASGGTNSVGLRAPDSIASDLIWTLPATDGSSGQVLATNGNGALSWVSPTVSFPLAAPAGSAAAPSYSFSGSASSGIYSELPNYLSFSTGGSKRFEIKDRGEIGATIMSGHGSPTPLYSFSEGLSNGGDYFLINPQSGSTGNGLHVKEGTTSHFVVDGTGNVGVGTASPASKLHVAGDIKMGNSGAGCNATTEGSMRYNSGTKKMEFCNGSTWANVGGGLTSCRVCTRNYDNQNGNWSPESCTSYSSGNAKQSVASAYAGSLVQYEISIQCQ